MAETKKVKPKPCGNPDCGVSPGICESLTFGSGELDDNGYWERPCPPCARAHETAYPQDGRCWPFEGQPKPRANVRRHYLTKEGAEAFLDGVGYVNDSRISVLGVKEIKTGWLALLIDRDRNSDDDQMRKVGEELVFDSPFKQYEDRNRKFCTVRRVINLPDDRHDEEVLPMYVVQFRDGREIEAWPEELREANTVDNETPWGESHSAF